MRSGGVIVIWILHRLVTIRLYQFTQMVIFTSVILTYLRTLKNLLVLILLIFYSTQEFALRVAIFRLAQLFLMSTILPDC